MEGETIEHVRFVSHSIDGNDDRGKLEADLSPLDGVRSVTVDPSTHAVDVVFDPRVVDLDRIQEVMDANGYPVSGRQLGAERDAAGQS